MLYTYYGDDFTGSTDVLETLANAGIPAALFTSIPTPEDLAAFPELQAVGIAGDSRSRSPEWMSANLPAIFAALRAFNAPITHYKTCSTFDSAPHVGSIGRALEVMHNFPGAPSHKASSFEVGSHRVHPITPAPYTLLPTPCPFIPIVVGAPHLGRFVLFGNLFATANGIVHRIDRHPTMSRHPATPMLEADLRRHLVLQTDLPIALLDLRNLHARALDQLLTERPAAILFDTFDESSLKSVGALIWHHAQESPLFAAGSSGLTAALISAWRTTTPTLKPATPVDQILVLSGSCSPITQSQIEHALATPSFHGISLEPAALIANPLYPIAETLAAIARGQSPILYTSLGPLEPASQPHAAALGTAFGVLLHAILSQSSIRRTLLCGGDTSSHAIQQLPIRALTHLAPLTPGAPLCQAHAAGTTFHHTEFILKGGQIGPTNFVTQALAQPNTNPSS